MEQGSESDFGNGVRSWDHGHGHGWILGSGLRLGL